MAIVICDDVVGLILLPHYAATIGLDSVDEGGARWQALEQEERDAFEETTDSRRVRIGLRDDNLWVGHGGSGGEVESEVAMRLRWKETRRAHARSQSTTRAGRFDGRYLQYLIKIVLDSDWLPFHFYEAEVSYIASLKYPLASGKP